MEVLRDNVLIKEIIEEGNIALPDGVKKEGILTGEILSTGPDVNEVKDGHTVYFNPLMAHPYEDMFIIKEEDILAYDERS